MWKNRNNPTPGFTLLELIVVMLILAIAAAMVIPAAVGTTSQQAQAAARMVMADLEYAQNYAITTQCETTASFDPAGNAYLLTYKDPVSNQSVTLKHPITHNDYRVDFDTAAGFGRTALSSVDFGGTSAVVFNALGAPDHDGALTVTAGAHAYRVTVAPVTGRVTVNALP
jgi:prepilin-type N-terminal cleavage/methylation domain-containing protein